MTTAMETVAGETIEVLPIGTLIRNTKHPELVGRIKGHEYHESGKISFWPYLIAWDDSSAASAALGWFFVYAGPTDIEVTTR